MPVLSEPRNDVGGAERTEGAAANQTGAQPEVEPVLIAEPQPDTLQDPSRTFPARTPNPVGDPTAGAVVA